MKKKLITLVILFLSHSSAYSEEKTIKGANERVDFINKDILYNKIVEEGIEFPKIVLSQAIFETGHFKSGIYRKNKNLFGMKKSGKRETTAINTRKGYAVYSHWKYSVKDYKLWQEQIPLKHRKSSSAYLKYLQRHYCDKKSSNYSNIIKKMSKK